MGLRKNTSLAQLLSHESLSLQISEAGEMAEAVL